MGLMACDDNCPMELPLQMQLAFVRRKMAAYGLGYKKEKHIEQALSKGGRPSQPV